MDRVQRLDDVIAARRAGAPSNGAAGNPWPLRSGCAEVAR